MTLKNKEVSFNSALIDLGISMQLPKHFEAHIVPRSSSFKNFGFIQANHMGVIDAEYCGDKDVWKLNAIAIKPVIIAEGSRICQFRIMPSQKAPVWVKLKWLFTHKITFVEVDTLGNKKQRWIWLHRILIINILYMIFTAIVIMIIALFIPFVFMVNTLIPPQIINLNIIQVL